MSVSAISAPAISHARADRAVGLWLFLIAAMIGLMVVVGGLTRLTGSGLSITEWQPVTGIIPPLDNAAWQSEFAKYQGTPQYDLINRGIGLAGFKAIYWWEWTHRMLGRVLGVAFLIPFLVFRRQGRIDRAMTARLAIIFLLGAAQGVLGWWMVQSGLTGERVAVSQYRLAAHLGLAMILFGYVFWAALEAIGAARTRIASVARFQFWASLLVVLIFVQLLLGAFMAGLDAGLAFSSWPTYAGAWIPRGLYDLSPWWINHFENPALVHFQHRSAGYAVALLVVALYIALRRAGADRSLRIAGIHAVVLTTLQIALGIFTVISMVALPLAALHQICALALFAAALWWTYALNANAAHPAH
ncbi:MAG TPA: COX15/CtaA family protein [Micropepsaceae bacterium]|nr:COX15/CtaA family protein [Micropepsaceae bacterium]